MQLGLPQRKPRQKKATSLELTGTEAHHTHFARSLMPQLRGGPGDAGRATFSEGGYNVYGDRSYSRVQESLLARLLHWYVLTADGARPDKGLRGLPPFYPTAHFKKSDWRKKVLD